MQNLTIELVQSDLFWHQPEQNREHFAKKIAAAEAELVVLPEMFTTGFTMAPEEIAEPENGPTLEWMVQQAAEHDKAVCGSVVTRLDAGGFANRFLFVTPAGEVFDYDKRHLFRMAGEHKHYRSGDGRQVIIYKGWRILPQICYDLRFPVFSRNRDDYDLAIYVANWPEARRHAWRTLLQARAIENQAYVVGVNRVGVDAKGLSYSGDTMLVDYQGQPVIDQPAGKAFSLNAELQATELSEYRTSFPAWQDADQFELKGI